MYWNPKVSEHLKMGGYSVHRNVGLLALSGRQSLVVFGSGFSQQVL